MKQNEKTLSHAQWVMAVLFIVHCSLFITVGARAQTFTQRLQRSSAGEGRVTLTQSQAIDALVNGPQPAPKPVAAKKPAAEKPTTTATTKQKKDDTRPTARRDSTTTTANVPATGNTPDTTVVDHRKKVMRGGYKVTGYRVQAFAGGNQRTDRQEAERTGNIIKQNYPDEPIYVHFYSPRWICRVGNYRTYEEAQQMLNGIRKLGFKQATIVKGKITVPY